MSILPRLFPGLLLSLMVLCTTTFTSLPVIGKEQDKATENLVQQLKLWESRYRTDMINEVLEKLFNVDPDHLYGLEVYSREQLRIGNSQQAQWAMEKIRLIDSQNPAVSRLRALHRLYTKDKAKLQQARAFALGGRAAKAKAAFEQLFNGPPPTPELAVEYWQLVFDTGEQERATAQIKRLSEQYPDNIRFRLAYIAIEIEKDEFDLAYIDELALLGRNPITIENAIYLWRRAVGNLPPKPSSIPYLKEYLKFSPSDNAIHTFLVQLGGEIDRIEKRDANPHYIAKHQGLAALNNEQLALAERKFRYAMIEYPNDPELIGGLGYVRMRQGNRLQAISFFKKALKNDPDNQDQWTSLIATNNFWINLAQADLAIEQNEPKQARKYIAKAAQISPDDAEIYVSRAYLASSLGKHQQAKRLYRQALRKEPDNASAIRGLLRQYSLLGQRTEATRFIASLQREQQQANKPFINSIRAGFIQQDVVALDSDQQQPLALNKLKQALKLTPDDPWLRYDIAKRLAGTNQIDKALAMYSNISTAQRQDVDFRYSYALFLSSVDKVEESLKQLSAIRSQDKTDGMLSLEQRLTLTQILEQAEQTDDFDTAQNFMAKALVIARKNNELFINLSNSWRRQGSYAQALEAMKEYLKYQSQAQANPDNDTLSSYIQLLIADNHLPQAIDELKTLTAKADITGQELLEVAEIYVDLSQANSNDLSFLRRAENIINKLPANNAFELETLNTKLNIANIEQDNNKIIEVSTQLLSHFPMQHDVRLDVVERLIDQNRAKTAAPHIEYLTAQYQQLDYNQQLELLDYINAGSYEGADNAQLQQRIGTLLTKNPLDANAYDIAVNSRNADNDALTTNHMYQKAIITRRIEQIIESAELQSISQMTMREAKASMFKQNLETLGKEEAINQVLVLLDQFEQVEHSDITIVENELTVDNYQVASLKAGMRESWLSSVDYIEVGFDYRQKDGADGRSDLRAFNMPIEARFHLDEGGSWFFRVEPVYMHAGNVIMDDPDQSELFGAVLLCQLENSVCPSGYIEQKQIGASVAIGIEKDNWKADIGTIPINFEINDWVGGFEYSGDLGLFYWSTEIAKRPIASSLLSFSGSWDPYSGQKFGGVTSTGVNFGFGYDQGESLGIWSSFGYHKITGTNVLDNSRTRAMGGIYYRLFTENPFQLTLGLNALTWSYEKDLSEYTFGQGGYYSPQSYASISLPIDLFGQVGDNFSYLLRVIPSASQTSDDFSLYYPTNPFYQSQALLVDSGPFFNGDNSKETSIGMSYQGAFEWRFATRWTVGATFSIERSDFYEPSFGMIYFRYALDPLLIPLNTPPKPVRLYQNF